MDRISAYPMYLVVVALAAGGLAAPGCVSSNGAAGDETRSQSDAAASGNVTDAQLDAFARANRQIHQIRMETREQLEAAETERESKAIRENAVQQIRSIFDEADISEEEYHQIGRQLENDRDLRQRLKQRLDRR